jgi:hypothetical protein
MTTITIKIDERTKAGKAFIAVTNYFIDNKGIELVSNGLNKPAAKAKNQLLEDFELACKQLKETRIKKSKENL